MHTVTTIHMVPVKDFVRLQGAMGYLRLWTLANGGCYYSCQIKITDDLELILFTNDMDGQEPNLHPTDVYDSTRAV